MSLKKIELQYNIDLKKYTSIKIGGKAKYFFTTNTIEDLQQIINDFDGDLYLLGAGSNLLIKDDLLEKPVVKLADTFNYLRKEGNYIEVGASTPLSFLVKYCVANNLKGVERLAGIPATIGGLLQMNASSFGQAISSYLEEVDLLDKKGQFCILKKRQIVFGYRFSSMKEYIILRARFRFKDSKPDIVKQKVIDSLKKRIETQDFDFPSCGSVFKNPEGSSAGFLIDSCGLKGAQKGKARISLKHANFIVNLGSARFKDVDYLIQKIKEKVYKVHKVILEEEVKKWI